MINLCTYIFLSERARSVHPWPLGGSHLDTASFYYLPDLSSVSLFSPCFLQFQCLFFIFYFFGSCAFVYSEHGTAGEPGAVAGIRGCSRVERGGVGWSAVAVFMARHSVSIEIRGKHEWALFGLVLWSWI